MIDIKILEEGYTKTLTKMEMDNFIKEIFDFYYAGKKPNYGIGLFIKMLNDTNEYLLNNEIKTLSALEEKVLYLKIEKNRSKGFDDIFEFSIYSSLDMYDIDKMYTVKILYDCQTQNINFGFSGSC